VSHFCPNSPELRRQRRISQEFYGDSPIAATEFVDSSAFNAILGDLRFWRFEIAC
jgi:hypothetical protein